MAVRITSPAKKRVRVDMTPLIDVVFLLLIFFMLTFAMPGKGMDLNLPEGQSSNEMQEKPLTVQIDENDSIQIDGKPIDLESIQIALTRELETRSNKMVILEASKKARYEFFSKVVDIARQAGVKNFSIVM